MQIEQQNRNEKPKLIVLRHRNSQTGYAVTQRDFEEWFYLKRQMKDAAALFKIKDATIRRYIELGCVVEPGVHMAHLNKITREADTDHPHSFTKLVIK